MLHTGNITQTQVKESLLPIIPQVRKDSVSMFDYNIDLVNRIDGDYEESDNEGEII